MEIGTQGGGSKSRTKQGSTKMVSNGEGHVRQRSGDGDAARGPPVPARRYHFSTGEQAGRWPLRGQDGPSRPFRRSPMRDAGGTSGQDSGDPSAGGAQTRRSGPTQQSCVASLCAFVHRSDCAATLAWPSSADPSRCPLPLVTDCVLDGHPLCRIRRRGVALPPWRPPPARAPDPPPVARWRPTHVQLMLGRLPNFPEPSVPSRPPILPMVGHGPPNFIPGRHGGSPLIFR